jgi:hypothetical protein
MDGKGRTDDDERRTKANGHQTRLRRTSNGFAMNVRWNEMTTMMDNDDAT